MAGPNGEAGPVPSTNVAVSSVQTIVSGTSGYQIGLSWLNDNDGFVGPVVGNRAANIGRTRGHYWFQSNNQGNCNTNPVPTAASSSGNIQCQNCSLSTVNCSNCQTRAYLQGACNCACTYNCTTNQDQSYNCNCNCNWFCACACSDPRLKENVNTIQGALHKVVQLRGVDFTWNDRAESYGLTSGQRTSGLMADETKKIVPETVSYFRDMLTIDQGAINGLLVEAVKELKQQIENLKSKE
jgi:hypothetical protein